MLLLVVSCSSGREGIPRGYFFPAAVEVPNFSAKKDNTRKVIKNDSKRIDRTIEEGRS